MGALEVMCMEVVRLPTAQFEAVDNNHAACKNACPSRAGVLAVVGRLSRAVFRCDPCARQMDKSCKSPRAFGRGAARRLPSFCSWPSVWPLEEERDGMVA